MNAIRQHLFVLAGLVVIGLLAGLRPATWVAVGLAVSLGTHSLAHLVSEADRSGRSRATPSLVLGFTILGLVLALVFTIVIFLRYGWIPALGVVALFLGYFLVREDRDTTLKRKVQQVRELLLVDIAKQATGQLTEQQLEERSALTLGDNLPEEGRRQEFLYGPFLEKRDLQDADYKIYLVLLERFLSRTEGSIFSRLHREVRSRLGLRPFG